MKKVTHKLWPVSYADDNGRQVDAMYNFDPSRVDKTYWVGEPIEIEVEHKPDVADALRAQRIIQMREQLAKLEAGK